MSAQGLTLKLSGLFALPEPELIQKGLLALVEKEIRLTEQEIVTIRERYDAFSKEALYQLFKINVWQDIPLGKITLFGKTMRLILPNCARR